MAINNNHKFRKRDDGKQLIIKVMNDLKDSEDKVLHYPSDLKKYGVFNPAAFLTNIVPDSDYPNFVLKIDKGEKTIPSDAFVECSLITSVWIPNTVEEIGEKAFSHCTALTEIVFEEGTALKKIGAKAFSMTGITEFEVPPTVTELGEFVFYGCSELTKLTLPKSITVIPNYLCRDASRLTDIVVEGEITEIGNQAFRGCSLTSFNFTESINAIGGSAFAQNHFTAVDLSKTTIFSIANAVFKDNEIVDLKISPYTQIIGAGAFSYNQLSEETIQEVLKTVCYYDATSFEFQDFD